MPLGGSQNRFLVFSWRVGTNNPVLDAIPPTPGIVLENRKFESGTDANGIDDFLER